MIRSCIERLWAAQPAIKVSEDVIGTTSDSDYDATARKLLLLLKSVIRSLSDTRSKIEHKLPAFFAHRRILRGIESPEWPAQLNQYTIATNCEEGGV